MGRGGRPGPSGDERSAARQTGGTVPGDGGVVVNAAAGEGDPRTDGDGARPQLWKRSTSRTLFLWKRGANDTVKAQRRLSSAVLVVPSDLKWLAGCV